MGTLEPRKNFISLARAYVHLPEYLKQDYTLVLAGGTGWNSDSELAEIKKYQEENEQIVLTGYVSDAMRQSLYAHASLFVLPSFYEGFGMPLLEAMAFDVPVIASNIEVFHEVCGNAAAYVDPKDTKNMTNTITELLTKKELRNSLIRRGNRQVKSYSWDSVARKLYDLFKSSGGGDHPNS